MRGKGFTLIEVVVALAILGVGLIVIIELFSGGLRLGRTTEEYTRAMGYARMKMEEITVQPSLKEGTEEGEFADGYRWRLGVKRMEILPEEKKADYKPPVELLQVRVEILWKSGSRERSADLQSYKMIKMEEHEEES